MKKRKLKIQVLYSIYALCFIIVLSLFFVSYKKFSSKEDYNEKNIPVTILPVIKEKDKILKPFIDKNVKIGKYYYDYKSDDNEQQNSLISYENTFLPNTGVDYVHNEKFDIVSILDGKISKILIDKHLGKTVEIKYKNNYIGIYQSLSDILVKEGDNVLQGQVIAKSGESNISKELGNHLHFELIKDNKNVNPEKYYFKELD